MSLFAHLCKFIAKTELSWQMTPPKHELEGCKETVLQQNYNDGQRQQRGAEWRTAVIATDRRMDKDDGDSEVTVTKRDNCDEEN